MDPFLLDSRTFYQNALMINDLQSNGTFLCKVFRQIHTVSCYPLVPGRRSASDNKKLGAFWPHLKPNQPFLKNQDSPTLILFNKMFSRSKLPAVKATITSLSIPIIRRFHTTISELIVENYQIFCVNKIHEHLTWPKILRIPKHLRLN